MDQTFDTADPQVSVTHDDSEASLREGEISVCEDSGGQNGDITA